MSYNISILVMYALTPCHAGSGSALGIADLPIQRERHTNYPLINSSSVKGSLRANFDKSDKEGLTKTFFGSASTNGDGDYAGAISVSDAKILAFPMRSSIAPFVWITCPNVLKRLNNDLLFAGKNKIEDINPPKDEEAIVLKGDIKGDILLEDYQVEVKAEHEIKSDIFKETTKLLLVSDEVFKYGVSNCTQINAQIAIEQEKGSTKDGSLRYQEELPSDTLMYCTISCGDGRNDKQKASEIEKAIKKSASEYIQVGGSETLGRGIFKLTWK
ncbi:MAG: type III-B CRISPR module RAMP protein Cmr4 [Campylobacteraceae bacterium]|jgi:CRISPR-associated protein Cmr4|nr:type III-B CRISPR module RAMP protein Cmr4 [Campylobacteraceae bacterium]